jgi:hypothetical protein
MYFIFTISSYMRNSKHIKINEILNIYSHGPLEKIFSPVRLSCVATAINVFLALILENNLKIKLTMYISIDLGKIQCQQLPHVPGASMYG